MKKYIFIMVVFVLCWGCHDTLNTKQYGKYIGGRLYAVSDIGSIVVEGIYTLEYVKQGSEKEQLFSKTIYNLEHVEIEQSSVTKPVDGQPLPVIPEHPHFPDQNQMKEIEQVYKRGDLLAYCKGPDSGWALLRRGSVICVWLTEHSF